MYSIDSSGKGFKVDEVKYDLQALVFMLLENMAILRLVFLTRLMAGLPLHQQK